MDVRTGTEYLPNRWRPLAWLALIAFMLNPMLVLAQPEGDTTGTLKPGDTIRLTVPGRPELDREVTLDSTGHAAIEPVGKVLLGGLNSSDATLLLKQKLRLFYPTLDVLRIDVGRAGAVRIYVLGSVSQRGVLNFETTPTLWDVMRAIGGPSDTANLRDARIIREVDGQPEVHPVNLTGMMDGRSVPAFPMQDGDTLVIPALAEGIPAGDTQAGVKVFGSVGVPTIVPLEEGTPLMDVLMLAGAPTAEAQTKKIHWIHNDGVRTRATVVDLQRFLLEGDEAGNPLIYPGDTINVEFNRPNWVRQNVPFVLGSVAAVATIWLAYDRIVNE